MGKGKQTSGIAGFGYSGGDGGTFDDQLRLSVERNDLPGFKSLVSQAPLDIKMWVDSVYKLPLIALVAKVGRLPMVKWLFGQNHVTAGHAQVGLREAILAEHLAVTKFFSGRASFQIKDEYGENAESWSEMTLSSSIQKYVAGQIKKEFTVFDRLSRAIKKGQLTKVKGMKARTFGFQMKSGVGKTPAHLAALHNQLELLKYFDAEGVDLDAVDESGVVAIQCAVLDGSVPMLRYLLSKKVSLLVKDRFAGSLLGVATICTDVLTAKAMLTALEESGFRVKEGGHAGSTPLHDAAVLGRFDLIPKLVEAGFDVTEQDADGVTPLQFVFAVKAGDVASRAKAVTFLLSKGAKVHMAHSSYEAIDLLEKEDSSIRSLVLKHEAKENPDTALCWAARFGDLDLAKAMIQQGGDIDGKDHVEGKTPSMWAAQHGQIAVLEWLKSKGANFALTHDYEDHALNLSVGCGDLSVVRLLVDSGMDVNEKSKSGRFPLLLAAGAGDLEMLEWFVSNGADVNAVRGKTGSTALATAAASGEPEIVNYLLDHDADVNHQDEDRETALALAWAGEHWEVVASLVDAGADLNQPLDYLSHKTPLMAFAERGSSEWVQWAIDYGADATARSAYGLTALHYACVSGDDDTVGILLEQDGVDVNAKEDTGCAPIMNAAEYGHADVIRVLLASGADLHTRNASHMTLAHSAAAEKYFKVAAMLLQAGVDPMAQDVDGHFVLHTAALSGNFPLVQLCVSMGVGVDVKDHKGHTPLAYASDAGHLPIVKYLVGQHANVNTVDSDGSTPLMAALLAGHHKVANYLVARGTDVHVQRKDGATALICALYLEDPLPMVKKLLKHGVDPQVANEGGYLAVHYAAKFGELSTMDHLLAVGAEMDRPNHDGVTPLMMVAEVGCFEGVKHLVAKHVTDIHAIDSTLGAPAHLWAVYQDHMEIVRYLLRRGADVNATSSDGMTLLAHVVSKGDANLAKWLLSLGAKTDLKTEEGYQMAHMIAKGGSMEIYEVLADQVEWEVVDEDGDSPAYFAAMGGDLDMIKALKDRGVDLHQKSHDGGTILDGAVRCGHIPLADYLVKHEGFDLFATDDDGYGCLHLTITTPLIESSEKIRILEYMTRMGGRLDVPISHGRTVGHLAVLAGHQDILVHLLEGFREGYDKLLSKPSFDGLRPLHLALAHAQNDVLNWLQEQYSYLDYLNSISKLHRRAAFHSSFDLKYYLDQHPGEDINATDPDGNTALHWAALGGEVESVALLLKRGATKVVNQPNQYGLTPLHLAALRMSGDLAIDVMMQYLLDESADLDALSEAGDTPLSLALRYRSMIEDAPYEAIKFLLRKGARLDLKVEGDRETLKERIESAIKDEEDVCKVYQAALQAEAIRKAEAAEGQVESFDGFGDGADDPGERFDGFDAAPVSQPKQGLIGQLQAVQAEVKGLSTDLTTASPSKAPARLKRGGTMKGHYLNHLVADYVAQEEERKTIQCMHQYPNLDRFHDRLATKLEEVFMAYKTIASGSIQVKGGGLSKQIKFAGMLLSLVPMVGGLLNQAAGAAADKVKGDEEAALLAFAKRCSKLGRLNEVTAEINRFAMELTIRYQSQLMLLKEKAETKGGMGHKMVMGDGTKEAPLPPAEQLAEYAAMCVFVALQQSIITKPRSPSDLSLSAQFLKVLFETDPETMPKAVAKAKLPVERGPALLVGEMFYRPGALDYDARRYVAEHTAASIYGYRYAKPEELEGSPFQPEAGDPVRPLPRAVIPWVSPEQRSSHKVVKDLEASAATADKQAAELAEVRESRDEMAAKVGAMEAAMATMQMQLALLLGTSFGPDLTAQKPAGTKSGLMSGSMFAVSAGRAKHAEAAAGMAMSYPPDKKGAGAA